MDNINRVASERALELKKILEKLHNNVDKELVKKDFKEKFGEVTPAEIAEAEKLLVSEGLPPEEIQNLCDIHASIFENGISFIKKNESEEESSVSVGNDPASVPGHPLMIFLTENRELLKFIEMEVAPKIMSFKINQGEKERLELLEKLSELMKIDRHYSIKENLLFPYLEKNGVTAPPKVMWGVDDEIRAGIKSLISDVESMKIDEEAFMNTIGQVRSMIKKENEILTPLLLENIDEEDWHTVAKEIPNIGYSFAQGVEGASPSDAKNWIRNYESGMKETPVIAEMESDSQNNSGRDMIVLPSGRFSRTELERMLNTLPCDITFVGTDGTVHYFSEGKDRVFPRTRTIIGRKVEDCHPPKSLDKVQSLVDDFKAGRKDEETFWIQRMGKFILIRYYAVRSDEGEYLGVMEVTEEISALISLEGDKTLAD